MKKTKMNTQRLTTSAVMLGLATALAMVCAIIPFLNLPFGGGYTIASMLPIVIISYMYGMKWGFFSSAIYAVIQIVLDLYLGKGSVLMALFTPASDDLAPLLMFAEVLAIAPVAGKPPNNVEAIFATP